VSPSARKPERPASPGARSAPGASRRAPAQRAGHPVKLAPLDTTRADTPRADTTRPDTTQTQVPADPALPGIDDVMDRASAALLAADYFACEALCVQALHAAHRARAFERMARILMPLQESRRQRRHEAVDSGRVILVKDPRPPASTSTGGRSSRSQAAGDPWPPGCYLVCPPLVGVQARDIREALLRTQVPAMVLCREPTTSAGLWPVVAVGPASDATPMPPVVRVRLAPPKVLSPEGAPDPGWMLAAQEALGDAALAKVNPAWPADHRVEDLLEWLDAIPDHEKLAQALEATCREAAMAPPSRLPRRRGKDDPFSF
jgi:hypothetical protein